ncbi:MAG TPA: response regulator [Thermoanaerobaculia bacterium]|nr:response regulator [Thermoanaerobaculia bacterium]
MVDPEFADLVPLFAEEARDRLERLAGTLPRLEAEPAALAEARRELHTLKGAGRMLQIAPLSELCHAAEELLAEPHEGMARLLLRTADRLAAMVEEVALGRAPEADAELLALLAGGPAAQSPAGEAPDPAADAPSAAPAPRALRAATELRLETSSLDALAERATQMRLLALGVRQVVERLYELAQLAEGGLREAQPFQVLAGLATMLRGLAVEVEGRERRLARSADEQIEKVLALQLQPLRAQLQALARAARDLARSLGCEVDVLVGGEETRLDRRIVRELEEALIHLVRNAVDHGIEPAAARLAAGKSAVGRIRIEAVAEGPRVRLTIEDDGAGVDPERVRAQAVAAGLVDARAAAGLSRDAVFRFLFSPGFSTRDEVSDLSGRGVGLDVVASAVGRVGGEVFFDAEPGRGTRVILEVPVARRGEGILVLAVAGLKLGLPSSSARRTVRLPAGAVVERDGRTLARVEDRLVGFVPLGRLAGREESEGRMLVEGMVSGQPFAVAVDDVLGEEEVLVRPLARAAAADRLIEGAALLASGEPIGILAPAALAERSFRKQAIAPRVASAIRRVRVLLVDDSLVTREMERRLLEDAGFEVRAVADAPEALSRLGEERFDCVVTDIEMPGMDGLELTARLRAMESFAQLPIVVVSTRDRSEDRLRGLQAGADAYLAKQSLNAGELVDLVRRLGGRFAP